MVDWRYSDPREHFLDARTRIIIATPKPENAPIDEEGEAFGATVETEHSYKIFLHRWGDGRKEIKEDEMWPHGWKWAQFR